MATVLPLRRCIVLRPSFPVQPTARQVRRHSSAGFTLIELLVVIGIIALLAALIFPAIQDSMRQGKQVQSLANLKSWAVAFQASLGDFDQEMPSDGGMQFKIEDDNAWYNRLPPRIDMTALRKLPSDQLPKMRDKSVWVNPGATDKFTGAGVPFCYGFNDYLSTLDEPNMRVTKVVYKTKTILMAEKNLDDPSPAVNPDNFRTNFGTKDPMSPEATANVIFVDGHGETLRRKVLTDTTALRADTEEEHQRATITWLPFEKAQK